MKPGILVIILLCCLLGGCLPSPYYQKDYTIPKTAWTYDYKPGFKLEVTDTTALYDMYFIIRHTDAYPNANLWLIVHTKKPGDSIFTPSRIEVTLASPEGQWLGTGTGDIWEHRVAITHPGDTAILHRKGTWEVQLQQDMRVNPLPEVLQVGLRVEKTAKR